jgi:hypothetical protein
MYRYLVAGLLCVSFVEASAPPPAADEATVRRSAAAELAAYLTAAEKLDDPAQQIALFKQSGNEACRAVPQNVLLPELFAAADQVGDSEAAVKAWRSAIDAAATLLRFEPVDEAPLPEGFPPRTPVGELRVLDYPTYRLARTEMKGGGNGSFWTLFKHIKSREIAMTAPVEMTYDEAGAKQTSMSFLYRTVRQGRLENDDRVAVVDVPATTVVSFGLRGNADAESVAAARARLAVWLKEHADRYSEAGPLRVMGHNSPFVSAAKRYHEVQIPIRRLPLP